jgi:hypothetical protein
MAHPNGSHNGTTKQASGDGGFARNQVVRAAAVLASTLALGACFQLLPDVTTDGGADSGVDVVTGDAADAGDTGEACPPASGGCDFSVDHSADAGRCSYATIGAAVAAAQSSSCSTSPTVHVAAGTYSTATGETFPIVARGVLIEGADQKSTIVSGAGPVSVSLPVNGIASLSPGGYVAGTFLVGDGAAQTSISNLSITASPLAGYTIEGIVCDRGNAIGAPTAVPNTKIDHVKVQGFDAAVRVTWSLSSTTLSGCNALIVHSVLQGGSFGVIADGYGPGHAPGQVSLQLGDRLTDGNQLLDFHFSMTGAALNGAGLAISDGVTGAIVRDNTFANSDFGIWIVQGDYDPIGFDIEDNTIGPIFNEGVGLTGRVAVSHFVNNKVQYVSMLNTGYNWLGVGLAIGLQGNLGMPFIALARNNTFVGNDVGVDFRSNTDPLPTDPSEQSDFGTAASPGGNVFRCNSAWAGMAGGDVFMEMTKPEPPSVAVPVVSFEGNSWDHAPPTTVLTDASITTVPRGLDVYVYGSPSGADGGLQPVGGAIDTAAASIATIPCPDGSVPGP